MALGIRMLSLDDACYGPELESADCLSSVTHLRVSCVCPHHYMIRWRLRRSRFPALIHLNIIDVAPGHRPDLSEVAGQLELVAVNGSDPGPVERLVAHAPSLMQLRTLVFVSFPIGGVGQQRLGPLLSSLPGPLDTLDLARSPVSAGLAAIVLASFERGEAATSQLQRIRLPSRSTLGRWVWNVQLAMNAAGKVANATEAPGIQVEWA